MNRIPLRRMAPALALFTAVAACAPKEDPRLKDLTVGISKDSAIAIMGGERPSRVDPYLVGGQYIESMLFIQPGTQPVGVDTLPDRKRSPVVMINGNVAGWGWGFWDSVSTANGIPLSPQD